MSSKASSPLLATGDDLAVVAEGSRSVDRERPASPLVLWFWVLAQGLLRSFREGVAAVFKLVMWW